MKYSLNKSSKKLWLNLGKYQFFAALYKKPAVITEGITNETQDGWYVPFIDYDQINYSKLRAEALRLIRRWQLSGLAVIKTKEKVAGDGTVYGNYHLIGFDKLRFHEHLDMLMETCCDRNYIRVPNFFRFKHWVLRIAPKIEEATWKRLKDRPYLKEWIQGFRSRSYTQSMGHYHFMRKYYGLKSLALNWDAGQGIQIIRYNTTGR